MTIYIYIYISPREEVEKLVCLIDILSQSSESILDATLLIL